MMPAASPHSAAYSTPSHQNASHVATPTSGARQDLMHQERRDLRSDLVEDLDGDAAIRQAVAPASRTNLRRYRSPDDSMKKDRNTIEQRLTGQAKQAPPSHPQILPDVDGGLDDLDRHRLARPPSRRFAFGGLRDGIGGRLQLLHDVGPAADGALDGRAQAFGDGGQAADRGRGLVGQLIGERSREAEHAEDHQHRRQRARHAPAGQRLDNRVERVADQHADQHRHDERRAPNRAPQARRRRR